MTAPSRPNIDELIKDGEAMTRAMRAGVAEEIRRKKALGYPIVVWRDGEVVEIPAEDLPESGYFTDPD